jgi:hypothetical protein
MQKVVKQHIEKIKLFVLFLDHLQGKYSNNYEVHKIMAEFFMKLFNNENVRDAIGKVLDDIRRKKIKPLYNINLEEEVTINKINYTVYSDESNQKVRIHYNIRFNDKCVDIEKMVPKKIYDKVHDKNNEKYLFLLYTMIGFDTGHFWGLHPECYSMINKHFSSSVECFASPFNHNLDDYYSVLYPVDQYYGSKGDFFDNFMDASYEAYVINPPFVESIIARVLDMIERKLEKSKVNIFFYIPQWDDLILPWYKKLESRYQLKMCKLDKNSSIVYDYIADESIKATFGTYFIYINNITFDVCDIMRL